MVAPLNWGLGHAARCIPLIKALQEHGFTPIIASDGVALSLLKKEFPELTAHELPSYQIEYAKEGKNFKWKLLRNSPKMIEAVVAERKVVKSLVKQYDLCGIISDNRLGVFSKKVPSVFITHQLNVLSGNTSWLTSYMHQLIIKKYAECWVPDFESKPNLTGKLGHIKKPGFKLHYLGPLSRLKSANTQETHELFVILSGPEPQRGMLEARLREQLQEYDKKAIFVRGVMDAEKQVEEVGNVTYHNFMQSEELQATFNQSKIVLCRSGYTTVMDLACLGKKEVFFIPTPGQFEQEYLAKRFKSEGLVPYATQEKFRIRQLAETKLYKGLPTVHQKIDWKKRFKLFQA